MLESGDDEIGGGMKKVSGIGFNERDGDSGSDLLQFPDGGHSSDPSANDDDSRRFPDGDGGSDNGRDDGRRGNFQKTTTVHRRIITLMRI